MTSLLRLPILPALGTFALALVACGGDDTAGDDAPGGDLEPDGGGGDDDGPDPVTTDCGEVCQHLLTCEPGGDLAICEATCATFRAGCRACLAGNDCATINAGDCDLACADEDEPEAPPGADCVAVTYVTGAVGSGDQRATGDPCLLPRDCLSSRCLTADLGIDESVSWCGNQGDCREPVLDTERCPDGWSCLEVARYPDADARIWACVPPDVDACDADELE
jgi:hypothetical protein